MYHLTWDAYQRNDDDHCLKDMVLMNGCIKDDAEDDDTVGFKI